MLQLDFSIVNVALPSIQRELDVPASTLQWLVTGYALTYGSLLLLGGRAADILGRRTLLTCGLTLFAIASVGAGVSQSSLMLIGARVVQGCAGALIAPAALSLLTTSYPDGPARSRALGTWQATTAAGATAGILVGGVLTQAIGWRAIFLVNPPIVAAILILAPRVLPAPTRARGIRVDLNGAALSTLSLAAVIYGLSNGQQKGFVAVSTVAALAVGVGAAAAFVLTQRRSSAPMIPRPLLTSPTRRSAVEVMVLLGAVLAAYVYFASLYFQRVEGYGPIHTGLALLPSTLTVIATSTFASRSLLARFGTKPVLIAGLLCVAAAQLWLSRLSAGASYLVAAAPGLVLTGLGIGLTLPTASVAMTTGVAADDQGAAGGLFVTAQQAGAALGLAALATVAASQTDHLHSLVAGYRLAFLISAALAAAAVVVVGAQIDGRACDDSYRARTSIASGHRST